MRRVATLVGLIGIWGDTRAQEPIRVGEYATLSGPEQVFGESSHNGVLLAIEQVNSTGGVNGRPIELIALDDGGTVGGASAAVTRLIEDEHAVALLGEVVSQLSIAGARVAQAHGVPMISPASTAAALTDVGDKISRAIYVDALQGRAAAVFARHETRKAAILYDPTSAYSTGLRDAFAAEFTGEGGKVVTEQTYTSGDADFAAPLAAIRKARPELLFVPGYYTDAATIALQARQSGLGVPLLGGDGWDSEALVSLGGRAVEGASYVVPYAADAPGPELRAFIAAYRARFGAEPDALAACGYDAAHLLLDALARAPTLGGDDLAAAIAATRDLPSLNGPLALDAHRDAVRPALIVTIHGGRPTWTATLPLP